MFFPVNWIFEFANMFSYYIYIYTHTYYIHTYIHACMHTCIHIYIYIYTYHISSQHSYTCGHGLQSGSVNSITGSVFDALYLSWIPKASRVSVYRSWRGGTYTHPKWPRMQNICKTHMKHRFLRWWNVCDAYVKRMCSASEHICEPYVKYMWNICEIHVTY